MMTPGQYDEAFAQIVNSLVEAMSTWTTRKTVYGDVRSGKQQFGPLSSNVFYEVWFTHERDDASRKHMDFTVDLRTTSVTCTIDGMAKTWDTLEGCLQTLRIGVDVPEAIIEFGVDLSVIADDLAGALQGQTQTSWSA